MDVKAYVRNVRVKIPAPEAFYGRRSIKDYSGYKKGETIPYHCAQGHSWIATKGNSRSEVSCPYCWCRELLPGFNDVASQFPELATEWDEDRNTLNPDEVTFSYSGTIHWNCSSCGHSWEAILRNRTMLGSGCPACHFNRESREYKQSWRSEAKACWSKNNISPSIPPRLGVSLRELFLWDCPLCGEEFSESPRQLYRRQSMVCPTCRYLEGGLSKGNRSVEVEAARRFLRGDHPLCAQWSNENPPLETLSAGELLSGTTKFYWECPEGHVQSKGYKRKMDKPGCGYCTNRILLKGFNDLASRYPDTAVLWSNSNDKTPEEVPYASGYRARWECPCGTTFTATVVRMTQEGKQCPGCGEGSLGEKELQHFVRSLLNKGEDVSVGNRTLINPLELDIVLPQRKIAMEYNGIYWHSDEVIPKVTQWKSAKQYHQSKVNLTKARGYQLLIIWEDDWVLRREEVEESVREALSGGDIHPMLRKTESRYSKELGKQVTKVMRE